MPDNVSVERRQLLELFGAEIELTDGARAATARSREPRSLRRTRRTTCRTSTAIRPTRAPTTRRPVPRSSRTARRWTSSWRASGTGGTLMGVGRRLQGAQPERSRSSRPSRTPRTGPGAAQPRPRLHPADPRPGHAGSQDRGPLGRRAEAHARADRERGHLRRAVQRRGGPRGPPSRRARWSVVPSSCCWPTGAGSTSRPACAERSSRRGRRRDSRSRHVVTRADG